MKKRTINEGNDEAERSLEGCGSLSSGVEDKKRTSLRSPQVSTKDKEELKSVAKEEERE